MNFNAILNSIITSAIMCMIIIGAYNYKNSNKEAAIKQNIYYVDIPYIYSEMISKSAIEESEIKEKGFFSAMLNNTNNKENFQRIYKQIQEVCNKFASENNAIVLSKEAIASAVKTQDITYEVLKVLEQGVKYE